MKNTKNIIFKHRRKQLIQKINNNLKKNEPYVFLLFGNFEFEQNLFRQESFFYYLTGINEPGAVLVIFSNEQHFLYIPNFGSERKKWLTNNIEIVEKNNPYDFDCIKLLGKTIPGYSLNPFQINKEIYHNLIEDVKKISKNKNISIYSSIPYSHDYLAQHFIFNQFTDKLLLGLSVKKHDLTGFLSMMRRCKDQYEIELIKKAIAITEQAQKNALSKIRPGIYEYEICAEIDHTFISSGSLSKAFPSIVASGKNTTVLHYLNCNKKIGKNDLVIVDIGTNYQHYASDLTRTYPASRKFSQRQKEIYQLVLDAQKYILEKIKVGMFLRNEKAPELSLHHLAKQYFSKYGYEDYFYHGIGHFMGLDVHDVGIFDEALKPGDVFTIEPGLYIQEKGIGVRIEDNFYINEQGKTICLSKELIKEINDIEQYTS
jgi:Xaa-Pro aminopeptidase